jgi:cytochrome c oxidase subunit 1
MALTETRPETNASPDHAPAAPTTLDGLLGSADHKTVGRLWIGAGLFFLIAALAISAVAAFEGSDQGDFAVVEGAGELVQLWSLGRELLLLGAVVPILVGLATYITPLQIGAPAIAFARGAAGAFWTWLLATGLLVGAYLLNGGPGGGRVDFVELWVLALGAMVGALVWAMLIVVTTVLGARTVGMTLERVPHTSWSFLVFCLIGVLSLPVVLAELVLTYVRVRNGLVPLDARQALVGVTDSLSLAPALFWVAVPVLGMAADVVGVHTSRPVRAHKPVMVAVGVLGVLAYGADYLGFASVRAVAFDHGLLVVTIAAAILPMLAVLALVGDSIRNGAPTFRAALIGTLVAGLLLVAGAAASFLGLVEPVAVFLANETSLSIDLDNLLILNGTMFHDGIRGLVLGATIVALIASLHHWSAKIWGRRLSESIGLASMLAVAAGALLWGVGAILAGVDDQPAYPEAATTGGGENTELFSVIVLVGLALMTAGALAAALNAAKAAFGASTGPSKRDWSGLTLEWATPSPPPPGNFAQAPVVRSATPLADGAGGLEGDDAEGGETAGEEA